MKEKVYFKNLSGTKLCGIISNPTDSKNRRIIIMCHGFATNKDGRTYTTLEKLLNEKNISTLRFDFYGHGESEGKFEDITVSLATDDILSAVKYLKGCGYTNIGLLGGSFGGIASIMAASKSADISILVLKSPVSNYMELYEKYRKIDMLKWKEIGFRDYFDDDGNKYKLNYSFVEDFSKNDGYTAGVKINIPTLIVHGDEDKDIPIAQSIKIQEIIPNCKLERIKGADHRFLNPEHFTKMSKIIVDFIVKNS